MEPYRIVSYRTLQLALPVFAVRVYNNHSLLLLLLGLLLCVTQEGEGQMFLLSFFKGTSKSASDTRALDPMARISDHR